MWKIAENSILCFMFNKEKSCSTRTTAIFWSHNGKKTVIFLETSIFHRFIFTLGSAHPFVIDSSFKFNLNPKYARNNKQTRAAQIKKSGGTKQDSTNVQNAFVALLTSEERKHKNENC